MNFTGILFYLFRLALLGGSIYALVLATRFVNAVERIAARMPR